MCEENPCKEMESCQGCGIQICFDVTEGDDIVRPAYVTASGDLYCDRCGKQHDRDEDREIEDESAYFEGMD
jgi:hypothetical protein